MLGLKTWRKMASGVIIHSYGSQQTISRKKLLSFPFIKKMAMVVLGKSTLLQMFQQLESHFISSTTQMFISNPSDLSQQINKVHIFKFSKFLTIEHCVNVPLHFLLDNVARKKTETIQPINQTKIS